jgi:hypothetical protein
MPETPDFDAIARALLNLAATNGSIVSTTSEALIAELRLVWNARGAADLVKIEAELSSLMGVTASGPYVKNLDRAIRSLDR